MAQGCDTAVLFVHMKTTVLCFRDSNTWGCVAESAETGLPSARCGTQIPTRSIKMLNPICCLACSHTGRWIWSS